MLMTRQVKNYRQIPFMQLNIFFCPFNWITSFFAKTNNSNLSYLLLNLNFSLEPQARRDNYASFYKNYDAEAEFQRMKAAGVFNCVKVTRCFCECRAPMLHIMG